MGRSNGCVGSVDQKGICIHPPASNVAISKCPLWQAYINGVKPMLLRTSISLPCNAVIGLVHVKIG